VLGFRTSSALTAAYGIAVTSTMVITTLLAYLVARDSWGVSRVVAGSLAGFFLAIDLGFFGATSRRSRRAAGSRSSSAP
jgi:KUP system potassium uptake protein